MGLYKAIELVNYENDTQDHIKKVRRLLRSISKDLYQRGIHHDESKFSDEEEELYSSITPKMNKVEYNSKEYKELVKELGPAVEHHYQENSHHPEHYSDGIKGMSLVDLIEMLCDWKAASMRKPDSNLLDFLDTNQKRFGFSDELKQIFENTINQYLI